MKLHQPAAFVVLWILLCTHAAQATTYYLSTSGNNSFAGTSPAEAWASLSKINSCILQAGDSLLLEGGSTFEGGLFLGAEINSKPGNPFVISSYGEGWATINSGNACGLQVYNAAGIHISRLHFIGAGRNSNTASGIEFYMDLPVTRLPYIRIDSVEVEGYRYNGIVVGSWSGSSGYDGVSITNARVHDIGENGITSYAEAILGHTDFYLAYNKVYNISGIPEHTEHHSGSGIVIGGVDGALVEHCEAYNNGWLNAWAGGGPVGIWGYRCNKLVIQYSESHHNKTGTGKDGGGFDIDGGCTNCTLQYNYSHDNEGPGYLIAQYPGAPPLKNAVIRYNISENDARKNGYGAIHLWSSGASGGIQDAHIYNNTVYLSPTAKGSPKAIFVQSGGVKNGRFRNNILQTTEGLELVHLDKNTDVRFEGNNYWSSGAPFKVSWAGAAHASLQKWQQSMGQEMHQGTATGSFVDPQFKAPGQGITLSRPGMLHTLTGYQLKSTSTLPGKALDLQGLFGTSIGQQDFWSNAIHPRSDRTPGAHQPTGNSSVCLHGGTILLEFGTEGEGVYSGRGVLQNQYYDPTAAGTGPHALRYTYTDRQGNVKTIPHTLRVVDASSTAWQGRLTGNDDWFSSDNWTSCVPTPLIDAHISPAKDPAGSNSPGHLPKIRQGRQARVKDLWARDTLPVKGGGSLEINGEFQGHRLHSEATATIIFNSKNKQHIPTGSYGKLVLRGREEKKLEGPVFISQELLIGESSLALGEHDIRLGPDASISNASAASYLVINGTGKLIHEGVGEGRAVAFPIGTPLGYTPAMLINKGIPDDFSISIEDTVWSAGTAGTPVNQQWVNKTWHISEKVAGGSNVSLSLQWNTTDEMPYFDRWDSYISHFEGGKWSLPSLDALAAREGTTAGTYVIELQNIHSFSPFGISNQNFTLPVTLSYFDVKTQKDEVLLRWETAMEKENQGFDVEVSEDGHSFRPLGFVASRSSIPSVPVSYSYRDQESGKTGMRYYRLRQLDVDGSSNYSVVKSVSFGYSSRSICVYPNPFQDHLMLNIQSIKQQPLCIHLITASGKEILTKTEQLQHGHNTIKLLLNEQYPPGIYLLKVQYGDQLQQIKLIKR